MINREYLKRMLRIRSKDKFTPRKQDVTAVPRVSNAIEEEIEPVFERALRDYKKHFSDVVPDTMRQYGVRPIRGDPFPEGDPELRVTDRIMGSNTVQGLNLVEDFNGVHSVVNISEALADDAYYVCLHELAHNSLSQRGIDLGDKEENIADAVAYEIARREVR